MPVQFQNFDYMSKRNGKPVFAPTQYSRQIGHEIKLKIEKIITFPDYFYHLRPGGHVAALHSHRRFRYFAKIDIENFFYSISRSRVGRALKEIGIDRHIRYAKWSCVKNPYSFPGYSLPYGFVQSPILASLVLFRSAIGSHLDTASPNINVAVYVDDISLAADDLEALSSFYLGLIEAVAHSGFTLNDSKCLRPSFGITAFNCNLRHSHTSVTEQRIAEFYSEERNPSSSIAFDHYCSSVVKGNS